MAIKAALIGIAGVFFFGFASTVHANDCIFGSSFEGCPRTESEQIAALEARIAELERLLSGVTRETEGQAGGDTLTVPPALSADALNLNSLLNSQVFGDRPVCQDDLGNVLPCSEEYIPPPAETLLGPWSGVMTPDPLFSDSTLCVPIDIGVNVASFNGASITSVKMRRGDDLDIFTFTRWIISAGFADVAAGNFGERWALTFQFDPFGAATGDWTNRQSSAEPVQCFGTFELTRE